MTALDWLLESDPSIRWQTLRDLGDAPAEVVETERGRVATEGWGARLLALQGNDGLWEGGAMFPGRNGQPLPWNREDGQPWTATAYSLVQLQEFGVDPNDDRVSEAVELVRDNCRWEHAGQPFFEGEVEPCINGMVVVLGAYFGQDVDGVVDRLVDEQLEDGGWNCEVENGSVRGSFNTTIRVLEGLLAHEQATGGSADAATARRRGEEYLLERRLLRRKSTGNVVVPDGCSSHIPRAGTTTCCAASTISDPPVSGRTIEEGRRSSWSARSSNRTIPGCSRTRTRARSTSRWMRATVGRAAGTRCALCESCAGTTAHPPDKRLFRGAWLLLVEGSETNL